MMLYYTWLALLTGTTVLAASLKTVWHVNKGQVSCRHGPSWYDQDELERRLRLVRHPKKEHLVKCEAYGKGWRPYQWYEAKVSKDIQFRIPCQRNGTTTQLSCCYGFVHNIKHTDDPAMNSCSGYGIEWQYAPGLCKDCRKSEADENDPNNGGGYVDRA